jgi:hypothetical protein
MTKRGKLVAVWDVEERVKEWSTRDDALVLFIRIPTG